MRLKTIFILCFLSLAAYLPGQKSIPGYKGSVNAVSFRVMPVLFNIEQIIYPNIGFEYERAISRKTSITVSAGIAPGIMDGSQLRLFDNQRPLRVSYNGVERNISTFTGSINYNNNFVSVSKAFYMLKSGSIAPQGKYLRMGLTLNQLKIKKENNTYGFIDNKSYTTFKNNTGVTYKSMNLTSFNLEFGSKRFISKSIFYQKSLAFNVPFNFWSASRNKTYYNIEDYNENALVMYISKIQTLNCSLSIGMAF
jgi:hypothetical protein